MILKSHNIIGSYFLDDKKKKSLLYRNKVIKNIFTVITKEQVDEILLKDEK